MQESDKQNSGNIIVSLQDAIDKANDFFTRGLNDKARELYEVILAKHPGIPNIHNKLGLAYRNLARNDEALVQYQKAIESGPDNARAYNNMGMVLLSFMQMEQAEKVCRTSLELKPGNPLAWTNLGNILRIGGRKEEAIECYRKALALDPSHASAWRALAEATTFSSFEQEEAQAILKLEDGLLADDPSYTQLHFALGKIFADLREYGSSFRHYQLANDACKVRRPYQPNQIERALKSITGFFNDSLFKNNPDFHGSESDAPIFIIGMPRSGKTLLESLLTGHPSVYGAGEMQVISDIVRSLATYSKPFPASLAEISRTDLAQLSKRYLQRAYVYAPDGATRIIDTMPTNFLNLGLIHLLLPNARMIHCKRNASDCSLQNYFKHFAAGNECSYDLEGLAHYYRHYQKIMDHWHTVLPKTILTVDYEALVLDTQATMNLVTEYLGIDTITPDMTLHDREINSWKHYEPFLGPLVALQR